MIVGNFSCAPALNERKETSGLSGLAAKAFSSDFYETRLVKRSVLSKSAGDMNINLYSYATERPKRILILSGTHGNEDAAISFVLHLLKSVSEEVGSLYYLLEKHRIGVDFVPVLNVDGRLQNTRRNLNGVDLNRNFPINWNNKKGHGNGPLSEPESHAIYNFVKNSKFDLVIDVHSSIDWIVVPSARETIFSKINEKSINLERSRSVLLKNILDSLSHLNLKKELKTSSELQHGGSFEDSVFYGAITPAFCLELSKTYKADEEEAKKTYERFITMIIKKEVVYE